MRKRHKYITHVHYIFLLLCPIAHVYATEDVTDTKEKSNCATSSSEPMEYSSDYGKGLEDKNGCVEWWRLTEERARVYEAQAVGDIMRGQVDWKLADPESDLYNEAYANVLEETGYAEGYRDAQFADVDIQKSTTNAAYNNGASQYISENWDNYATERASNFDQYAKSDVGSQWSGYRQSMNVEDRQAERPALNDMIKPYVYRSPPPSSHNTNLSYDGDDNASTIGNNEITFLTDQQRRDIDNSITQNLAKTAEKALNFESDSFFGWLHY